MDWKQFISSLIENLSWPIAIFAMFYLFKSEIRSLIQKLAHLKYKDLELDFDKVKQQAEAIQIETKATSTVPVPLQSAPFYTSLEDQILDTVEKAPAAAILLAWSALETAIASAVSRKAISPESPSYRSPLHNIEMLQKYGELPDKYISLMHEMRILRNKVAHHHDAMVSISQEQALNYADAAIDLIRFLNQI